MPLDSSPIAEPLPASHHAHLGPSSHPHSTARPNLKRRQSTIPTPPQTQKKRVSRSRPMGAGVTGKVGKLVFPAATSQPARKKQRVDGPSELAPAMGEEMDTDPIHPTEQEGALPFLNPLIERGTRTPSPPSTPVRKSTRPPPPRADDENPFLVTPEEEERMLARRREREESGERVQGFGLGSGSETVTYVFRGVRQTMPNPLYNRPLSTEASHLPLSHPDYSPPPVAAPRLLFPPGQNKQDTLASIERQKGAGRVRERVGNVEGLGLLPTPSATDGRGQSRATLQLQGRVRPAKGLGLGRGLVDEPLDIDMDGEEDGEEGEGEVGRVVRMMPLVGSKGRGVASTAAGNRPIR